MPGDGEPLKIFADLVVFVGPDAAERKARLDELDGAELVSDARIFTGTADELADLLSTGAGRDRRLPAASRRGPADLEGIARGLHRRAAAAGARSATRTSPTTLRGLLGLPPKGRPPPAAYAAASGRQP